MRPDSDHDSPDPTIGASDEDVLDRYLAGAGIPGDEVRIVAWKHDRPSMARRIAALQAETCPDEGGTGQLHHKFWANIQDSHSSQSMPRVSSSMEKSTKRSLIRRHASIAVASIATMLLCALAIIRWNEILPGGAGRTYVTATGERLTISLDDGSTVTLAPHTVLTVPRNFGKRTRTLLLDGQARFAVVQASKYPFTVQTGDIETRVLGTVFGVKRYPGDAVAEVVVESGKVVVAGYSGDPATLVQNTIAFVTDSGANVFQIEDADSYTSWVSGVLDFREVEVPRLLATLTRWYGVRFSVSDSTIIRDRVTALLQYNNTADLVTALETVLHVTAISQSTDSGTVITLRPKIPGKRVVPTRLQHFDTIQTFMEVGR